MTHGHIPCGVWESLFTSETWFNIFTYFGCVKLVFTSENLIQITES